MKMLHDLHESQLPLIKNLEIRQVHYYAPGCVMIL